MIGLIRTGLRRIEGLHIRSGMAIPGTLRRQLVLLERAYQRLLDHLCRMGVKAAKEPEGAAAGALPLSACSDAGASGADLLVRGGVPLSCAVPLSCGVVLSCGVPWAS